MVVSRLDRGEPVALALGGVVRVALLLGVLPWTYLHWFVPFLDHATSAGSVDPWTSFLAAGGDPRSFPYGPYYLIVFAPLEWLGRAVFGARGASLGLGVTVLLLDIALLAALRALVDPGRRAIVTVVYWLSPISIYVCYWHGQLDVLPVLLLSVSLLLLRDTRFGAAGFSLGTAAAAKLSMGLAIPFVWIYVTSARRLRSVAARLIGATLVALAVLAPFAASSGFRRMVLETPEKDKAFTLNIAYGDGLAVYILPLVVVGLVYFAWRVRRFNFDVLFNLIGAAFFVLFLLTPASPGWAMWLMPFMVIHLTRSGAGAWTLAAAFSGLYVLFHLTSSSGAQLWGGADLTEPLDIATIAGRARTQNLLLSIYLAAGGAFAMQMLRESVLRHPFYRATRSPLVLGVAGDSGVGKDTLALALADLFGSQSTALVSGDDYHSWDRHKPMWRAMTHLNPRANDLKRFERDVLALASGRAIRSPHYDHHVGRMTKPRRVEPTDIVIAAGLHALHPKPLTAAYDLAIFLGMDEGLRRYYKIRRDVRVRGHAPEAVLASIEKREADSERYIRPQKDRADLVLALRPVDVREISAPLASSHDVRLCLAIEFGLATDPSAFIRALVAVGGLAVVEEPLGGQGRIVVEGDPSAADVAAAASVVAPEMYDFLALSPVWSAGLTGIMQLAVVYQIGQKLAASRY